MTNAFVTGLTSKNTRTENGALSNSSSGSSILDYFAKSGAYRNRPQNDVNRDMSTIFGEDLETALKVVFYNRLVTRKIRNLSDTVQKGQGNKDEFIRSLKWLESNYPELVYENLYVITQTGCWHDLWYDSPVTGLYHYVNTKYVYPLIAAAIENDDERQLVAKFLPKIRSAKNTKSDRHKRLNNWARNLCKFMNWTEKDYRTFKSNPENKAHDFQRKMCGNVWDKIDFNLIPGKALFKLVSREALKKHGLENKYLQWLSKQPVAKFTGYPFELLKSARIATNAVQKNTYNKQFDGLIELAKKGSEGIFKDGVLCALDTSGSMSCTVADGSATALDICMGLGIYFSSLNEGHFKDTVVMFDSTSRVKKLTGTFCDKVAQVPMNSMGSTNFQSVIDEIVRVRKQNPNIPISDFPKTLLVVSDMQFNPASNRNLVTTWNARTGRVEYNIEKTSNTEKTNYDVAMAKLAAVGLPKMNVIWWDCTGRGKDVPSTINDEGTTLISGFDGAVLTLLLGAKEKIVNGVKVKLNPYEMMLEALNQDVLNALKI